MTKKLLNNRLALTHEWHSAPAQVSFGKAALRDLSAFVGMPGNLPEIQAD
jgi:hypothetical protein